RARWRSSDNDRGERRARRWTRRQCVPKWHSVERAPHPRAVDREMLRASTFVDDLVRIADPRRQRRYCTGGLAHPRRTRRFQPLSPFGRQIVGWATVRRTTVFRRWLRNE